MTNMKARTILAATALAIAVPAVAQDRVFKEIDVTFDIESVENEVAATFWSDLEGDLETAILSRIVDRTAEDGSEIDIDIDELAMASSFQAAFGADSTLVGDVTVRNPDGTLDDFYEFTVTVDKAGGYVMDENGLFVNEVETEKAYAALIDTFAEGVVERLK